MERGYPQNFIDQTLSEVKFPERTQALLQRNKTKKRILPFVTQYHLAVPNLTEILTGKWYLIRQQPLLNQIQFKELPIISNRKGHSLSDIINRKSKIIIKARKPNHVFRSRVGMSTYFNTLGNMFVH